MKFSEKIIYIRAVLKLSQHQLANKLGLDWKTISRWENEENKPQKRYQKQIELFCEEHKISFEPKKTKEDLYQDLINKYGNKQLIVATEELSELAKELCKALRGNPDKKHIIEEIADVEIMLDQIKIYFDLDERDIAIDKDFKLERTRERLEISQNEPQKPTKFETSNENPPITPNKQKIEI